MKRFLAAVLILVSLSVATPVVLTGCKSVPKLEPGGAYAPTNSIGEVIYNDTGLALADASYQFTYESIQAVFKFERDNRLAIWSLTHEVKRSLDKMRPQIVAIDKRWAAARAAYRVNPTPEGLGTLQTILAEMNRLLPVIQSQTAPVVSQLTTPTH